MKRNKNFWSFRLHKLGTPKVLRMDGRSGPTTRPAFAKATHVKMKQLHKKEGTHKLQITQTRHPLSILDGKNG